MKKIKLFIFSFFLLLLCLGGYITYNHYFQKPDLTVVGFIDSCDGLGRQTIELINNLKGKHSINFISTKKKNCYDDVPFGVKCITKFPSFYSKKMGKVLILEDQLWRPGDRWLEKALKCIRKREDGINIAYSMFESTRIPPEWVMRLNLNFDAVCVPDPFLEEIYRNSGVRIPIFTLPLGLDMNHFFAAPLKKTCGYPMVFANLSACSDRKNQLKLVHAFAKAFGDNPNVQLILNSRYVDEKPGHDLFNAITVLNHNNIQFTQFKLDKKEYLQLFLSIDCYINISKGEGFSIQPREAMALGIPTILTENTGQSTLCKSGLPRGICSPIEGEAFYPNGKSGTYYGNSFDCELDEVVDALKDMYENYEVYLAKASKARKWVSQYQYERLRPLYHSLVAPKKIILGDENRVTADFIMTNSTELYNKYKKIRKL